MILIKKKCRFCSSHRLFNPNYSDEKNYKIFGKCSNENYHGHNYELEVAVEGNIDPDTGMVINFVDLKKIIEDEIVEKLDHKNLNVDVDFLAGRITTAENMAKAIFEILDSKITCGQLYSVSLKETEDSIVVYMRD